MFAELFAAIRGLLTAPQVADNSHSNRWASPSGLLLRNYNTTLEYVVTTARNTEDNCQGVHPPTTST